MEKIIQMLSGFKIIPFNNGGIEVRVGEPDEVPGVLATVAEAMFNYNLEDLQITTDQYNCKVYIDEIDREED